MYECIVKENHVFTVQYGPQFLASIWDLKIFSLWMRKDRCAGSQAAAGRLEASRIPCSVFKGCLSESEACHSSHG